MKMIVLPKLKEEFDFHTNALIHAIRLAIEVRNCSSVFGIYRMSQAHMYHVLLSAVNFQYYHSNQILKC
jgi:hypothetical protein